MITREKSSSDLSPAKRATRRHRCEKDYDSGYIREWRAFPGAGKQSVGGQSFRGSAPNELWQSLLLNARRGSECNPGPPYSYRRLARDIPYFLELVEESLCGTQRI